MKNSALRIAGWDVMSVFGDTGETAQAIVSRTPLPDPEANMRLVPQFDVRERLGPKGTRNYDRHTGLLAYCVGNVVNGAWADSETRDDIAFINGTSAGSVTSILDFMLDTWRHDRPYLVNPAHMPNTVLNCAAGQCAIRYGLRGPNATVSAGGQSFYAGLKMAHRWAGRGYARRFLVGAVEEMSECLDKLVQAGDLRTRGGFSEGVGVVALEDGAFPSDAAVLGVVLGTDMSSRPDMQPLVGKLLDDAGVPHSAIHTLCMESAAGSGGHAAESDVAQRFPDARRIELAAHMGNTLSTAGALQMTALLSTLPAGAIGLMISASATGSMACALVRQGAAA